MTNTGIYYAGALESLIGTARECNAAGKRDSGDRNAQHLLGSAGASLRDAAPMFWGKAPMDLVFQVAEQIDMSLSMCPELLYCQSAWCWFDQPKDLGHGLKESDRNLPALRHIGIDRDVLLNQTTRVTAISWQWGRWYDDESSEDIEGVQVIGWHHGWRGMRNLPIWSSLIRNGDPLSSLQISSDNAEFRHREELMLRFVVAAGAFLRTKLASTESVHPDRHLKKRIERESPDHSSAQISVVMLRSREVGRTQETTDGERFVDWQHQWIVRAHTRQQWYPGKGKHLPILVAPYVKGPEGKPLKVPTSKIFAVTR